MVLNEFASLCGNKSKRTARHAGLWTVPHALYRVRLPLETFHAVRAAVSDHFIVGCRYLADECIEGGNTPDDGVYIGVGTAVLLAVSSRDAGFSRSVRAVALYGGVAAACLAPYLVFLQMNVGVLEHADSPGDPLSQHLPVPDERGRRGARRGVKRECQHPRATGR